MKSILVNAGRCVACKSCAIACALNRSSLTKRLPEAIFETDICTANRSLAGELGVRVA
jgi:Fe-S-cluster-containing hydrogenase component 2